jgi:hypothetical protein
MSEHRDLNWAIATLKWVLNNDGGQPMQAFQGPVGDANYLFRMALNEAYNQIILEAVQLGKFTNFHFTETFTWVGSEKTWQLPVVLVGAQWLRAEDITDSDDGDVLDIGDSPNQSEIWFKDMDTLQWGTTGAPRDTAIRVTYLPHAESLEVGAQEPLLIPSQFRWLLVWRAAMLMRSVSNESVPKAWANEFAQLKEIYYKWLSKGRLSHSNPSTIRNTDSLI